LIPAIVGLPKAKFGKKKAEHSAAK